MSPARSAEAHPSHDQSDEALSEERYTHHCGGYQDTSLTSADPERLSRARPKHGDIDCAERADTGYQEGDATPIIVVTVDDRPAERASANAYWVMKQAALADGVDLHISSAFRTWDEQNYLYQCYLNQNCNNGNLAAPPGYSNHQSGHAFDLNTHADGVLDWLNAHGAEYGFERTVPSEPWHWEWWGGGPGGGPCLGLPCQVISAEGGVVDNSSPCFQKFGPAMYWREVSGEGEGGSLFWTNAFDSMTPDNWARWSLHLEEAGEYLIEVSVSERYGICTQTPYQVRHADTEVALTLNQSSPDYWQSLGVFTFAEGGAQHVDVYDNISGWSQSDQHITADAVRLTRQRNDPDPDPDPDPGPQPAGELAGELAGVSAGEMIEIGAGEVAGESSAGAQSVGGTGVISGAESAGIDDDNLGGVGPLPETRGGEVTDPRDPSENEADMDAFKGEVNCAQTSRSTSRLLTLLLFLMLISISRARSYKTGEPSR